MFSNVTATQLISELSVVLWTFKGIALSFLLIFNFFGVDLASRLGQVSMTTFAVLLVTRALIYTCIG